MLDFGIIGIVFGRSHLDKIHPIGTVETVAATDGSKQQQPQKVFFEETARSGLVAQQTTASSATERTEAHGPTALEQVD